MRNPAFWKRNGRAHCGGHTQGSYLYTLTLTDVATGWTECLPLLARTSDLVLTALERARRLFPFPILGIDTDNGTEFINADVVTYCEREHLTFTRGRPKLQNDQCYVEEKNHSVVRHVVGHDRLVGEHAYQQLGELYRALRLYVNCFQPSMKLLSKTSQEEDNRVRRVYDPAKTPLQRLLLSGVLSASAQHKLEEVAQALDPLALADQLEYLQDAVFRCAVPSAPSASPLRFAVEQCLSEPQIGTRAEPDPAALAREDSNGHTPFLNWRRSSTNPFACEWERILAWVRAHPQGSTRDLFEALQQLFPGRYQGSQYAALQRGVRKMRAYLRDRMVEDPWPLEVIHGSLDASTFSAPITQEVHLQGGFIQVPSALSSQISPKEPGEAPCLPSSFLTDQEETSSRETTIERGEQSAPQPSTSQNQAWSASPSSVCEKETLPISAPLLTIELVLQSFLEEVRAGKRRDKTLEWHQTALHSFQHYLSRHDRSEPWEITTALVRGWMAFLCRDISATGSIRVASTIHSYARSARAFCAWLVRQGYLARTPFVKGTMPKAGFHPAQVVQPEEFEHLLGACGSSDELMDHATARNRTLLWLFLETGLLVSEVCALRVRDVDREQGQLTIQGTGPKARRVTLGEYGRIASRKSSFFLFEQLFSHNFARVFSPRS